MDAITENISGDTSLTLIVHHKPKGEDGKAQVGELLTVIMEQKLKVGVVGKEVKEGNLTEYATSSLRSRGIDVVDVSSGIADAMCIKDDIEQPIIRKAAALTSNAMKWLVDGWKT